MPQSLRERAILASPARRVSAGYMLFALLFLAFVLRVGLALAYPTVDWDQRLLACNRAVSALVGRGKRPTSANGGQMWGTIIYHDFAES